MDAVSLAVAAGLAGSAKSYADTKIAEAIAALPKGVVWRGSVNYYADLPATPEPGDCYTVKYAGTEGTSPSGQEYAWGKYDGVNQWIPIGPDMSVYRTAAAQDAIDSGKADKVASPTAGNFAGLDANGNLTDSGKKASDFLQEHQSLAAYRTSAAQDVIDATKQDTLISSGATVGQFARITSVDANGKPTGWEPVTGKYELIESVTLSEPTSVILRESTGGNEIALKALRVEVAIPNNLSPDQRVSLGCVNLHVCSSPTFASYYYPGYWDRNSAVGSASYGGMTTQQICIVLCVDFSSDVLNVDAFYGNGGSYGSQEYGFITKNYISNEITAQGGFTIIEKIIRSYRIKCSDNPFPAGITINFYGVRA